jgi:hypothetical protein
MAHNLKYPMEIRRSDLGQLVEKGLDEFLVDGEIAKIVESITYGKVIAGFSGHGSAQDIIIYLAEKESEPRDVLIYHGKRILQTSEGKLGKFPKYEYVGIPLAVGPYDFIAAGEKNPVYEEFYRLLVRDDGPAVKETSQEIE